MSKNDKIEIVVVGEIGVGKTCLLNKYFQNIFPELHLETQGVEYFLKKEIVGDNKIRVKIWDVSGKESHKEFVKRLLFNCDGIVLVFDVTDIISFYKLKETYQDIKDTLKGKKTKSILIGNKIDLGIKVPFEDGLKLAEDNMSLYFETSAKEDNIINQAFRDLIIAIQESENEI